MREYPVSRAPVDARIQTIYGRTTEIMKTIVAKDLGICCRSTQGACPSRRPGRGQALSAGITDTISRRI